ncbi:MAG TPA: PilZ domain-containing protein [Xanthobacteraceae bacterium]
MARIVGHLINNHEHPMSLFWSHNPDNRRKSTRHDLHYLAQIDPGDGSASLSCIICDISLGGAKLTVGTQEVPEEFTLWFRRRCRVARRADGQIGVQFVQGS